MASIVALFGPRRGIIHELERRMVLGRSQDADLQLIDEKVSREHCSIEPASGGGHTLCDMGSRNGTFLNGTKVEAPAALKAGDEIGVGETVLVYEPSFEAMRARDGESTLVLTAASAAGARAGRALTGAALQRAGELALRAAMAKTAQEAAAWLADAAVGVLAPSALSVLSLSAGGTPRALLGRPTGASLNLPRALVETALRQGKALAMPEAQARPESDDRTTHVRRRDGEVLVAPIFAGGVPVGALCAARERPFDESEIAFAGGLAAAVGPAMAGALPRQPNAELELPVAESPSMREAMRLATAAAQVSSTVLLRGETGTGKEEIARAIHQLGPRAKGPFVPVNCGAIPAEIAESQLFGHEKGAFTGAIATHEGWFEQADGGTLFLDEVGELSPAMQAKLLRALQDRSVQRVGGKGTITLDVRVVAATNRDLKAAVKEGRFREDLYWRLDVLALELRPLRERREDVLPLAERFLSRLAPRLGRRVEGFTPEAREALKGCPWPGNARQLANAIERALVLRTEAGAIGLSDLPAEVVSPDPSQVAPTGHQLADLVRALEREQIVLALKRSRGVKTAAAEALGISRPTLDRKIEEYKIDLFQ